MKTMAQNACDAALAECVTEVMEAMFYMECERATKPTVIDPSWMFRAVRFTGAESGTVTIGAAHATAGMLAANFLGEDVEALTEGQVEDIFGETVNMICGSWLASTHRDTVFTLSCAAKTGLIVEEEPATETHHFLLEGQAFVVHVARS